MPRQKSVDRESMDNTREGGRYMEMTIERLGIDYRKMAERAYGEKLLHCRRDAIGLLSLATEYLSEVAEANEGNSVEMNKASLYQNACLVAFIQGASWTERLISEGQYVKAAAALKQDYELLARIHEVRTQRARDGRTPNMASAPPGSGRHYGELNKVAHPSNLDYLLSVFTASFGTPVMLPVFQAQTSVAMYKSHVWLCCEMARSSVYLLMDLLGEDHPAVDHCAVVFALVYRKALRIFRERESQPT